MSFDLEVVRRSGVYKSCIWIQYGILFETNKVSYCCERDVPNGLNVTYNTDANAKSMASIIGTNSIPMKMMDSDIVYDKAFFDSLYNNKLDLIKKINDDVFCGCTDCSKLEVKNWEPLSQLSFKYVGFSADYLCNCKCTYCHQDQTIKANYDVMGFVKSVIDNGYLNLSDTKLIYWGGGEPTLTRNFNEITDVIGLNHVYHFCITCITFNEKIAQYLEIATDGGITVSIDSGTPETYKKIKGVDQFHNVIANFKKYYERAKYKNRARLKYIVTEENCSELEIDKFLELIEDNGLYGISVFIDCDGNVKDNVSDKVRAGIYYLALRVPLVARCRLYFGAVVERKFADLNTKLRMAETWWHRLLIHKIEEKGIDIQKVIQHVREL